MEHGSNDDASQHAQAPQQVIPAPQQTILQGHAIILLEDDDLQDAVSTMKPQRFMNVYEPNVLAAEVHHVIETVAAKPVEGVYIRRRSVVLIAALVLVVLVLMVVGIAVGVTRGPSRRVTGDDSPSIPTQSFVLPSTIEKFADSLPSYTQEILLGDLKNFTIVNEAEWFSNAAWDHDSTFRPTSSQGLAWKWLMSDPALSSRVVDDITNRFALATLYYATNGDSWRNNTNWLSLTEDVCHWWFDSRDTPLPPSYDNNYPRFCEEMGFTHLLLIGNGLEGTIPPELGLLTTLTHVKLGSNSLYGTIPIQLWSSWRRLITMSLYLNRLSGSLPSQLGLLTKLSFFDARSNQLTGRIPSAIGSLSLLRLLHLYENAFTGELPTQIGQLTAIRELLLHNNMLTGSIPTELGYLRAVFHLDVGQNRLSGTIPTEIGYCPLLTQFRTSHNLQLSGSIPTEISQPKLLKSLLMGNCSFSGTVPTELGALTSLVVLDISNNRNLTGALPSELNGLAQLASLSLDGTLLSGPIPTDLCQQMSERSASSIVVDCGRMECSCNCSCRYSLTED